MAQAVGAGLSPRQFERLVLAGTWVRGSRGLFVVAGSPPTYQRDLMAACLAGGPTAMACRATAARLFDVGKPHFQAAPIEIVVRRGVSPLAVRRLGAVVHESRSLAASDRGLVGAIPVTRPPRLVVDMLGSVPDDVLWSPGG